MSAVGARERPSGRREDWPPLRYGQTRSRWIKTCKREKQMTSDLGKKKISKATQETRVEEMRRPEAGWPLSVSAVTEQRCAVTVSEMSINSPPRDSSTTTIMTVLSPSLSSGVTFHHCVPRAQPLTSNTVASLNTF